MAISTRREWIGLAGWLLAAFAAAAIGGRASVNAGSFYAQLVRPAWAPPGWLFGPVWTVLYLLEKAGFRLEGIVPNKYPKWVPERGLAHYSPHHAGGHRTRQQRLTLPGRPRPRCGCASCA